MRKTVPTNSLQRSLLRSDHRAYAPNPYGRSITACVIVRVWDEEALEEGEPPKKLVHKIEKNPGLLFAEVRHLKNQRTYYLPFKEPEDQIHSTYGNGIQLEGRVANIELRNLDIRSGVLIPQRTFYKKSLNLNYATVTFDIGALV